ncbi:outer membrane beta-barrel protein [Vulcaniibacterium tengchongense]|uniref:Ax21 family sulfation-dependent quorum factor n=1 Tax=Vulcaniibacterium tengchongense TaxID=1273429 RepID=A0A3N4VB52_9GAMM|nr:outer membrane beta-barrel protein [Vulcaniibacterium tengchongense]RPE80236.1 Ax21 family sulfation-dependent quorum factor [Vulcaniibacterium tengchongense]
MKRSILLAAALAAAPFAASAAEGVSYTYVEGGYAKIHYDERDLDNPEGDGGYIRGSVAISPSFNLFGSYAKVSEDYRLLDEYKLDVDLSRAEFGVGYRQEMGERLDFIAELAYQRLELEARLPGFGSGSDDAKGGRLAVGLRGGNARAEGWVKLGYLDGGDFEGDFVGTLGGQFKFNRTWGLVGEVEVVEDVTQYFAGVRASF